MSNDSTLPEDDMIRTQVRVMQIISIALVGGVVAFLVIVLTTQGGAINANAGGNLPMISIAAAGFFAIAAVMSFIVPRFSEKSALEKIARGTFAQSQQVPVPAGETGQLLIVCQTSVILSRALLEGPAFFGLVACMVEHHWIGLAVAVGSMALMLLTFPTESRVRAWLESRRSALDEIKQRSV